MKRIKATKGYEIFKKGNGRYSVKDSSGSYVTALEKLEILRNHGLIGSRNADHRTEILSKDELLNPNINKNNPLYKGSLNQSNQLMNLESKQSDPIAEIEVVPNSVEGSKQKIKNFKLEELELRVREYNCLKRMGISDLKDLLKQTEADLLKIEGFGKSSLTLLNELLLDFGLTLGMECSSLTSFEPGNLDGTKNMMLEDLGLGVREYNCLKAEGILDLNALIQKTEIELLTLPNFGKTSLERVLETLEDHGFSLGMAVGDLGRGKGTPEAQPIKARNLPLEYVNIGNREFKRLIAAGIYDLAALVAKTELDLLKMTGFGKRSLFRVVEALADLNLSLNMPSSSVSWIVSDLAVSDQIYINYPIENLGLPIRTYNCLINNQIKDVKTLLLNTERDLIKISGLGRTAKDQIVEVIKRSGMEFGVSSTVQWEDYLENSYPAKLGSSSEQYSIEFLPRNFDSTEKFSTSLGNFIDQYAVLLGSPRDKLIFLKRIATAKIGVQSLEDVGKELGVTRERVRQVEKKLILKLIKELIGGRLIARRYQVDPDFSALWREAISSFDGVTELSLNEFQKTLSSTWFINSQDFEKYINFICVIFTRKVKSSLSKQSKSLGYDLTEITAKFEGIPDIKLSHFRLGEKTQNYLSKSEIFTVHEFLDAAYSRSKLSPKMQFVVKTLLLVQLDRQGKVMWEDFFSKNNLQPIERKILSSRRIFLSELYNVLFDSLGKIKAPEQSQEIFRLRTSKHATNRETLVSVSERLYGSAKKQPHISRDQSVFLEKLHKIFVGRDFTEANFRLSDELINYFKESEEIHQLAGGDFGKFVYLIRLRFGVNDLDLDTATTLWTILDGYSPLRYFHLTTGEIRKRKAEKQSKLVPAKIKLSGFRDIY